ncbi:hypothetical protein Vadar_029727 [Vaccinium darrowii]|uniref:Uncharacterized protein n=1 Tax=Vaccinium darrowii TaxID=229202 RepID=A0ACB7XUE0_9ERIC|nr:hypothetical protein Vadar_029727 [Vaccinium darrowii]
MVCSLPEVEVEREAKGAAGVGGSRWWWVSRWWSSLFLFPFLCPQMKRKWEYYIYNPATRQRKSLPKPPKYYPVVAAGFSCKTDDPCMDSICYKVVRCKIPQLVLRTQLTVKIQIFSSETGKWMTIDLTPDVPFRNRSRRRGTLVFSKPSDSIGRAMANGGLVLQFNGDCSIAEGGLKFSMWPWHEVAIVDFTRGCLIRRRDSRFFQSTIGFCLGLLLFLSLFFDTEIWV